MVVCVAACRDALTGEFYVDSAAAAGGDGHAWSTAWKSFSGIDWSLISPGDTVLISGGSFCKPYKEPLIVGASGVPGKPLTVAKASSTGHNGAVVLDGAGSSGSGVVIRDVDYVVVTGLTVRNFTGNGQIRVNRSAGTIVRDNELLVTGHGGVWLDATQNITLTNNEIYTPSYVSSQTDGIYSQNSRSNLYEGNHIVISNGEPNGHDDGIQLYRDTDVIIHSNYIEQDNTKSYNSQGVWIGEAYGTITVADNFIYAPNTRNSLIGLLNQNGSDGVLKSYGNMLIGGQWGTISITNSPDSEIMNNVIISHRDNAKAVRVAEGMPASNKMDRNVVFTPNSRRPIWLEGTGEYSWNEWQQRGFEPRGINLRPDQVNLQNEDFALRIPSPAVHSGVRLADIINGHLTRARRGLSAQQCSD
jgi:hypothetical protein